MQMKGWSPRRKAKHAMALLAAGKHSNGDERQYDDCFENGRGSEVVAEVVRLYDSVPDVRSTLSQHRPGGLIGWSDWLETAAKHGVYLSPSSLKTWIERAADFQITVSAPEAQKEKQSTPTLAQTIALQLALF